MAPMAPASRPESSLGHLPGLLCPQMYMLYDACNGCPKAETPEVYGHSEPLKRLQKGSSQDWLCWMFNTTST